MTNLETRPWGSFTVIDKGDNHVIKKIVVDPFRRTSLQYHNKRREVWLVVEGEGLCYQDSENILPLYPGQELVIDEKEHHRIINTADTPLVIIETQYGECDEEDIVRLEDDYGRV